MCEDAVKDNITMCEGCLAADRTLTKLGKHTYLFNKLIVNLGPDEEPLMCWECISVFNKIYKFQQQVSKAQFTLKYKHEFDPEFECLSTLNKSNRIDYYDLEIEHKENNIYKCAVVKLEKIDRLINHYLNCNVDNNCDEEDKNDCNSDAAFFDSDEKNAVTNKDNEDETNDINYYDNNDCKSEVSDDDPSHFDFADNDIENKQIDNNDCKNEISDGDPSHFDFGDDDIENKQIDNNDCKSEVNDSDHDQSCYNFGDNDNDNMEIDNGGLLENKSKKKARIPKKRFRYLYYDVVRGLKDRDKLFKKVEIDKQELLNYMEKERSTNCESNSKINCALCLSKFSSEELLRQHENMWHSKSKKWMCDICKRTFSSQSQLKSHRYKHSKFVCLQCGHVTYTKHLMSMHVKSNHKELMECLQCQMRFPASQRKEFYKHYRDMHMTFICDYCGDQFNTKFLIERHMRKNHTKLMCKECNLTFRRYANMIYHNNLKHRKPQPSEHTYCVECDIQFPNELKFKNHLNKSKRHSNVTKRVQCPGCDKTYATKHIMTCHYNLVHLKKTDFFCEKCSKYFLNITKLKTHIKRIHLKIPKVKNKLCPQCGRGFSDLHVLTHHIRTHTGERPFSCEHCPAAFAQKIVYQKHVKSKHKGTLTQSNVQNK